MILESIGHSKYLALFIEHEIDYPTFITLEDADLKELGIKALGSRKKILLAIQECKKGIILNIKLILIKNRKIMHVLYDTKIIFLSLVNLNPSGLNFIFCFCNLCFRLLFFFYYFNI